MKYHLSFIFALVLAFSATASEPSKVEIIGRAQYGDKAAYLSMANGYHQGVDGFEKSMFNAKCCYDMAEADPEIESPTDEFALYFQLIGSIRSAGIDETVESFRQASFPSVAWVNIYGNIAANRNRSDLYDYTLSLIGDDSTGDECMIAFAALHALAADSASLTPNAKVALIAHKIPYLYNWAGEKALDEYLTDTEENAGRLGVALDCFNQAHNAGMLQPENAARILELKESQPTAVDEYFSPDELAKLRLLSLRL